MFSKHQLQMIRVIKAAVVPALPNVANNEAPLIQTQIFLCAIFLATMVLETVHVCFFISTKNQHH